jgi:hypothetical protein
MTGKLPLAGSETLSFERGVTEAFAVKSARIPSPDEEVMGGMPVAGLLWATLEGEDLFDDAFSLAPGNGGKCIAVKFGSTTALESSLFRSSSLVDRLESSRKLSAPSTGPLGSIPGATEYGAPVPLPLPMDGRLLAFFLLFFVMLFGRIEPSKTRPP